MLGFMRKEDIEHLATLARIRLTEKEKEILPEELTSIVSYVSTVSGIVADDEKATPEVGVRFNIFRKDEVTNASDEFTEDIMAEMPSAEGRFLTVKKILHTGD